jgi:hypothetical protein
MYKNSMFWKRWKKIVLSFGAITLFFEPACSRGLDYEYNYIA